MAEATRSSPPTGDEPRPERGREQLARGEGRWAPLAPFDEFLEEVARVWGWPFGRWPVARPFRWTGPPPGRWAPRVDVYEEGDALVVKADLPGVKKEAVRVDLADGDLVIRGEGRAEQEVKEEGYYRLERRVGAFHRRLPLPFAVPPEQIQARLTDGVLEVRLPKPAGPTTEPTRIPVT
jgi:HSP20 family protein